MLEKDWDKLDLRDVENLKIRNMKQENEEDLYEKECENPLEKETGKKEYFKRRIPENAPKKGKIYRKITTEKLF